MDANPVYVRQKFGTFGKDILATKLNILKGFKRQAEKNIEDAKKLGYKKLIKNETQTITNLDADIKAIEKRMKTLDSLEKEKARKQKQSAQVQGMSDDEILRHPELLKSVEDFTGFEEELYAQYLEEGVSKKLAFQSIVYDRKEREREYNAEQSEKVEKTEEKVEKSTEKKEEKVSPKPTDRYVARQNAKAKVTTFDVIDTTNNTVVKSFTKNEFDDPMKEAFNYAKQQSGQKGIEVAVLKSPNELRKEAKKYLNIEKFIEAMGKGYSKTGLRSLFYEAHATDSLMMIDDSDLKVGNVFRTLKGTFYVVTQDKYDNQISLQNPFATTDIIRGTKEEVAEALNIINEFIKPKVEKKVVSNATQEISPSQHIQNLKDMMNEDKQSTSIKQASEYISKNDLESDENLEGIDNVTSAIDDYYDIERAGQTPEDYRASKADAFQEIVDAIDNLSTSEEETELAESNNLDDIYNEEIQSIKEAINLGSFKTLKRIPTKETVINYMKSEDISFTKKKILEVINYLAEASEAEYFKYTPDKKPQKKVVIKRRAGEEIRVEEVGETKEPIAALDDGVADDAVNALNSGEKKELAAHYGQPKFNDAARVNFITDFITYVNKGAKAVNKAIRPILERVAKVLKTMDGVIVAWHAINADVATSYVPADISVIERTEVAPDFVKEMSLEGKAQYYKLLDSAKKTGKHFILLDKPSSAFYVVDNNGKILLHSSALHGFSRGDVLPQGVISLDDMTDAQKVTPAGIFQLKYTPKESMDIGSQSLYSLGRLDLVGAKTGNAVIAVHQVYKGTPTEKRIERLETPSPEDNNISYGCINVPDTVMAELSYMSDKLDGAYIGISSEKQIKAFSIKKAPAEMQKASKTKSKQDKRLFDDFAGFSEKTTGVQKKIINQEAEELGINKYEWVYLALDQNFEQAGYDIRTNKVDPDALATRIITDKRPATAEEMGVLLYRHAQLKQAIDKLGEDLAEARHNQAAGLEDKLLKELNEASKLFEYNSEAARFSISTGAYLMRMAQEIVERDMSLAKMIRVMKAQVGDDALTKELYLKIADLSQVISDQQKKIEELMNKAINEEITRMKGEWSGRDKSIKDSLIDEGEAEKISTEKAKKVKKRMTGDDTGLSKAETIDGLIKEMFRAKVEAGMRDAKGILTSIQNDLALENINFTIREIQDYITNYGQEQFLSQEEIPKTLRQLRSIYRLWSSLEEAQAGREPKHTGLQRDTPTQTERELMRQIREEMKRMGIKKTSPRSWQTVQETIITRLKNQILDIEKQLKTGERTPERQKIEYSPEAVALRELRDTLKSILNISEKKKEISEERRIRLTENALEKAIAEYERKITEQDFTAMKQKSTLESEKLNVLRKRRDELKATYTDMKKEIAKTELTDEQMIAIQMKRIENRIKYYQDKMKKEDYSKPIKRRTPYSKDILDAKFRLHDHIRGFHRLAMEERLKRRNKIQRLMDGAIEIQNILRALKTSFDFSYAFRQAGFLVVGDPRLFFKSFPMAWKAMKSERGEFEVGQTISQMPHYHLYGQVGLDLTEAKPITREQTEEAYQSRYAESIWGVGASARAYRAPLNYLRAMMFERDVAELDATGTPATMEEMKVLAQQINISTGRSMIGVKPSIIQGANMILFSARLLASRFQLLTGKPFRLKGSTARTRKIAAKRYVRFAIGLGAMWAAVAILGGDIEPDPRSADAGKFRFGKTRLDPMAGIQQAFVFSSRLLTGTVKKINGEKTDIYDTKYGQQDYSDVIMRFIRSKLAPAVTSIVDFRTGKHYLGEEVTPISWTRGLLEPMNFQDIYDVLTEQGIPAGTIFSVLAVLGMGLQTHTE